METRNLRAFSRAHDVTFTESFRTCSTTAFYGQEYLNLVETLNDGKAAAPKMVFAEVDGRNRQKRRLTFKDVALLYGHRPSSHSQIWFLSPYEFVTHWEPVLLSFPTASATPDANMHHASTISTEFQFACFEFFYCSS